MPFLVDGNNLRGAARDRRLGLPFDEPSLIALLGDFATRRSIWITVVFDGPAGTRRPAARSGRLKLIYSGSGRIADDLIVEMASGAGAPGDVTVVTSDRQLKARVRDAGCRVMGCAEFADKVTALVGEATEEKPLPGDIEEWERYFRGEE